VSQGRKGGRRAAAGFVLAAAGTLYSRLGGRRATPPELPEEPAVAGDGRPAVSEVAQARAELADELRRRASRPES
jgi:hypothetical protein